MFLRYHANVKKLLEIVPKDYKIIPGHGSLSSYEDLQEFEQMIGTSIERVKDKKNIGTDPKKISLSGVLKEFKKYSSGFISEKKWIKLIFGFSMKNLKLETFPMGSFACNCSLIYDDETKEAIIIDPGNDLEAISEKIEERNLDVQLLLHTHAHFDHIGCSKCLAEKTNSKIMLHKDDEVLYQNLAVQTSMFNMAPLEVGTIDTYLEDEMTFSMKNSELNEFLKTVFTPGHTEGSCCFYTESFSGPILFSGDTLFQNSIGRTDLPGGNTELILKSIKNRLYDLPDETNVITGHGPMTSIYHEKKNNPFVSG